MRFANLLTAVAAMACAVAAPLAARAQDAAAGEAVFNARCKGCHDPNIDRAPSKATLATYPAAQIVDALTNGVMKPMAAGLSDEDKTAVAAYLTGAQSQQQAQTAPRGPAGRAPAAPGGVDVKCAANPPIQPTGSDWTSVGLEAGHRFQARPGLTAADVAKLKVKWTFAMSGGSMPTV